MANLTYTEKNLTNDEYKYFERKFNKEIPQSFKTHYMAYNGGFPAEEDIEAGKWGMSLGFNPIKYGKLPIENLIDDLEDIIPSDNKFGSWRKFSFIPFAYDDGANPIFISLRDEDYGSIYVYGPDGGDIAKISSSFEEFLTKLYKTS